MKTCNLYPLAACLITNSSVLGFSFQTASGGLISLDGNTQRDVYTMSEWAASCGVQKCNGFELVSSDGSDYEVMTKENIPTGSPILYVPAEMCFSSNRLNDEFGGALREAENQLAQGGLQWKLPLFRIYIKILLEYERGEASPWYPWLDSVPRFFNTGASMTFACFDCLPPYAAWLAMTERHHSVNFQKAVQYAPLREATKSDTATLKWAYNVAITRSMWWGQERCLAPMADMFNHDADPGAEISYDAAGNCMVYALKDISAGSPVRVSLGDPTNPTPLFATDGFLDESSPGTFCKVMHLRDEMKALGYDFSNLLFYKETGDIAPEVFDVILYSILLKNDQGLAKGFYQAVVNGDEGIKTQYHTQYWEFTKAELQKHVDSTLRDLDRLGKKALSYDRTTHPRVPLILQHNAFVRETFMRVKQRLDNM